MYSTIARNLPTFFWNVDGRTMADAQDYCMNEIHERVLISLSLMAIRRSEKRAEIDAANGSTIDIEWFHGRPLN